LKKESRTHSVLRQSRSQLQKNIRLRIQRVQQNTKRYDGEIHKWKIMSRRVAIEQKRYAAGMADTQGWQFELAELAYTRIENAHKVAYAIKLSCLFMWLLCVELLGGKNRYAFVWAIMFNLPRSVARKCSLGLYVCTGRLDIENLLISPLIYSVSYFNLGAVGLCLDRRRPPKHPRSNGSESAWTAN